MVDETALIACAAYVDLNPIRAAMAQTLQGSDFTSAQRRIEAAQSLVMDNATETSELTSPSSETQQADSFLTPVLIDEACGEIGPCASALGKRCSDKGFFGTSLLDYFELLNWTARQTRGDKRGCTPLSVAPILHRLGLQASDWCELVSNFDSLFTVVAGHPYRVEAERSHGTQRRFRVKRRVGELMHISD